MRPLIDSLVCLITGHTWFDLVLTEIDQWDQDRLERNQYEERVCTRCFYMRAFYIKTVYSWSISDGFYHREEPIERPPQSWSLSPWG